MKKSQTTMYLADDGTPLCSLDTDGNLEVKLRKTSHDLAVELSAALLDAAKEQNKIEKATEKELASKAA